MRPDRRRAARYHFGGVAEVRDESGPRPRTIVGSASVISLSGCFVKTSASLPAGTEIQIRVTHGGAALAAAGRVVASTAAGLGIEFREMEPADRSTLRQWLAGCEATERPPGAPRRRSHRVVLAVPITVTGESEAEPFCEDTRTLVVNAHGALIALSAPVRVGQQLRVISRPHGETQSCRVAHVGPADGGEARVGIEFLDPAPHFWRIAFPPEDWSAFEPAEPVVPYPDDALL